MKAADFDYFLPDELIARHPLTERSASRLLCMDAGGVRSHRVFSALSDLLLPGDLLVFNNTKVIPARLFGQKATGGQVEVLIERIQDEYQALAHVRASKSPKPESRILFGEGIEAVMVARVGDLFQLCFDVPVRECLNRLGELPLPPYFGRSPELGDRDRYQTVYAEEEGSVAAPTAGLHFDKPLLRRLQTHGVEMAEVTLHVGAGTFQPVRVELLQEHHMHSERFYLSAETADAVNRAHARGGRVVAVGTTSVRVLESAAAQFPEGELSACAGETSIFIYPGYQWCQVDALITNFHLPRSTLLMLVCAFAGKESILSAYAEAIALRYRFFSYGDAMFLERQCEAER